MSNVGSISHYINDNNGFVWNINSAQSFNPILEKAIQTDSETLKDISVNTLELAKKFTFSHYLEKLQSNVI